MTAVTARTGSIASARLRAGRDHQGQASDHQERCAGADPKRDQDHALDGVRVARQTHQQPAGLLFVEVGEGKALDPGKEGVAQVAGHALGDLHRQDVVPDREQRAQKRNAEHQERRPDDHPLVVTADALVDDPLDQPGDRQFHDDNGGQEDQGESGALPVGPDKRGEFEDLIHHATIYHKYRDKTSCPAKMRMS